MHEGWWHQNILKVSLLFVFCTATVESRKQVCSSLVVLWPLFDQKIGARHSKSHYKSDSKYSLYFWERFLAKTNPSKFPNSDLLSVIAPSIRGSGILYCRAQFCSVCITIARRSSSLTKPPPPVVWTNAAFCTAVKSLVSSVEVIRDDLLAIPCRTLSAWKEQQKDDCAADRVM